MFSLFYHSKTCLRLHTNVVVYSSSRFFFIFFSFNYIWFHEICFFMKFVFVLSAIMSALVTVTRPSHSFKYNNSNTPFKKQNKKNLFLILRFVFPKVCMGFFLVLHFLAIRENKTKKNG